MYCKDENLLIDFDETAFAYVNLIYGEFLCSIRHIDRLKNENIFQRCTQKYTDALKQRLEGKALEYISTNKDLPTIDWFHKKLVCIIRQYLQDFSLRAQTV